MLYTRPVYFVPDLLPRTSIFCSGKKLYQSYMPTGSLQQDKPESLVIYPWRETHTQERGKGGELKRRLGNKKQQAKNWAFTDSLFVCVCFTPSTLQMWKKNTGTKKVESFERGLQGTYTHTQPENEGNREGKTTYPCRPHQVLRCPPIFSAFSLMQRSFVCVRTHHHAAHCCPATEAKVNSSNCKRGKQNKKGGDLRNELSVIRMRAIWNFEIGNTSPHFFFFFHVFLPFHSGLLHLHWRGRRCSITVLHIDSLGCCLEQLWGSSKVCSFLLFFPMTLTCQTSGGVKTRVAPGVWPFKRRRRRKGPLIHYRAQKTELEGSARRFRAMNRTLKKKTREKLARAFAFQFIIDALKHFSSLMIFFFHLKKSKFSIFKMFLHRLWAF